VSKYKYGHPRRAIIGTDMAEIGTTGFTFFNRLEITTQHSANAALRATPLQAAR
jgi:hypothetical protein